MNQSSLLQTAIAAARAAEAVIRPYLDATLKVDLKADRSPVTEADVAAEEIIHRTIGERFPDHGFYGEETGQSGEGSEYLWLVDPIDGTKSFVRGYPFFSTQIALWHRGQPVLGVSNAPLFGELAYAQVGHGAFLNDCPIRVSDLADPADATLSLGNIKTLAQDAPRWSALGGLIPRFNRVRGYGDFYHYHLLAAGKLDVVVESDVNILDVAALSVIVGEAGGRVTDLRGQSLNRDSTTILASNGALHDILLDTLG